MYDHHGLKQEIGVKESLETFYHSTYQVDYSSLFKENKSLIKMGLSACQSRLLACVLMGCLFPLAHSLSIPPTPSTIVVLDNDTDAITSTLTPINKEDGDSGLVVFGEDAADQSQQDSLEQSTRLGTKDSKRHVPSDLQPISQQSLEGSSTDDTNKIEATTESDVSGEQNANLSETLSGQRPVLEMVDVVLQPFRPPSVLILDFFRKPNSTRKTGSGSDEDDSGSTESNKGTTSGSSSNETQNTFGEESGISHIASGFDTRQDESIKSSSSQQKQFSVDNDNEGKDDAQKMGSDGEEMSSSAFTTTSTTEGFSVIDSSAQDNKHRRRRETHQLGNNSKEDGDDDALSGKSDNSKSSSISSKVTGKFQPTDDTTTATVNNDDDSTSTDDDDASHNTSANKSGTVKIFLEILQLVPLPLGSSTSNEDDDGSSTTTMSSIQGVAQNGADENDGTGVIHSSKANSNQKFSTANSTTTSVRKEVAARVARSATSPEKAAEKGNPSTSSAASASPSSATTSKPLTSKDAPAVPLRSANAQAVKASSTSTTVNDIEGPPLIGVTENPMGKSDDD
ncbi:hypothetical protein Ocin01_15352 [Orchesella cincta]|uniref:Uncharacterized protein n=1 Tax=Orchesella cincta TaxID=48709 RepID=A0A1D2MEB6_ORCCI|nr:hypothetical protein Ocin01_15352 [Orchesella cincta]